MNELPDTLPREVHHQRPFTPMTRASHIVSKRHGLTSWNFRASLSVKAIAGIAATLLTGKAFTLRISLAVSVRNASDY